MTNKKVASLARMLDAGVELMAARGSDQISVAEIAAAGRCSTATLYDAYGSKEHIVDDILERGHQVCPSPMASVPDRPDDALDSLLNFLKVRVEFLSRPRTAGLFKAGISRSAANAGRIEQLLKERDPVPRVALLIQQAMDAGDFRDADASSCAYCILAAVSFEPLVANLWFASSVDAAALIETALAQHLTAAGAQKLSIWMDARPSRSGASCDRSHFGFIGRHLAGPSPASHGGAPPRSRRRQGDRRRK